MNFGLYGQILLWIIEFLPYLKKHNIYPKWDIYSESYGNIFGKYILTNYDTIDCDEIIDLCDLKSGKKDVINILNKKTNSDDINFFKHFGNNFNEPNNLFFEYFKFSDEILEEVDNFMNEFKETKTLGIHYRGTDKINTEGGYINIDIFKQIMDDYLSYNHIDNIIIFTDEKNIFINLYDYYKNKYNIKYTNNFIELNTDDILWSNYNKYNFNIDKIYKQCIIDSIILSKCDVVIKTSSQFSAWSKIFNPNIEIYRISSFIHDWFPDSRIPIYKSFNNNINDIINNLFIKENKMKN